MSKLFVVPVLALVCLAAWAAPAAARDRDHDGLPDRWEKRHGLSTKKKSANRDPDHDHLKNRREHRLRLHPRRADTDRDGLWDRAELKRWKTNPRKADTDGDGFKDGVEVRAGTNPRDPSSHPRGNPPGGGGNPPGSPPASGGFPNESTTGVPAGWQPKQVRTSTLTITTPGAVIEDIEFRGGADLAIMPEADNVTVRRVKFVGTGQVNNQPGHDGCGNGLVVEDSTWEMPAGQIDPNGIPAIQWGGYTARRLKIHGGRSEGLFVGASSTGCGPVTIKDTLIKINDGGNCDNHADGIQGYDGGALTVRNVTSDSTKATCGTAPFFYPHSQGNTSVDIDRLLVIGGGYSFRLGMPGKVRGLKIGDAPPGPYGSGHSWAYGPIDVRCPGVTEWDASIVSFTSDYQVSTRRSQPCNTPGGGG